MPFYSDWEPAPSDMSLPVLEELPDGVAERYRFHEPKEAFGVINGEPCPYHYCKHCGGWIPGYPNHYKVNTLDSYSLSGRRGDEWYCVRCGRQIGFSGAVS